MKKVIMHIIKGLERLTKALKEAYDMTYGTNELSVQFKEEVAKRRFKNRNEFLQSLEFMLVTKFINENGYMPNPVLIEKSVEQAFEEAIKNGDVDSLYKLKEE